MSTGCPQDDSNTAIACLLRQVADNTKDNKWDPITLAVTAAIGVLALGFTVVTIVQGLFAANPGRIKASKPAIGPFCKHTRRKFDTTELAFRTTARVPYITWDVVYDKVVRQKYYDASAQFGKALSNDRQGKFSKLESDNARHQYDCTASWLTLLSAVGLDDPNFFQLVPRATDYLPADINCAPAAAQLRCLAILAVIAGSNATITEIAIGNRFLRVNADSSQLVFRDHPSLGTIAAYEAYEEKGMLGAGDDSKPVEVGAQSPVIMPYPDLDRCLQLASGRLSYRGGRIPLKLDTQADEQSFLTLVEDLQQRSGDCGHEVCKNAYENWKSRIAGVKGQTALKTYLPLNEIYVATSLMAADRANICKGFPTESMKLHEATKHIIALDKYWGPDHKAPELLKLIGFTFWDNYWIPDRARYLSATWVSRHINLQSQVANVFYGNPDSKAQHFTQEKIDHFMLSIRAFITKLAEPGSNVDVPSTSPEWIAQFLAFLDEWLLTHSGRLYPNCTMLHLLDDLGRETEELTHTRRRSDHVEELLARIEKWENDRTTVKQTTEGTTVISTDMEILVAVERIAMPTLLILRGIVFSMLLDAATDTSVLYKPEFRNVVVRMI